MKSIGALLLMMGSLHPFHATAEEGAPQPTSMQNKAAKLAGLAGFVNMSCPEIRADKDRFRAAVQAMKIDPDELEQGQLRLTAQSYIAAYQKDAATSCRRAAELFGRNGSVISGVFVSR
ncbi:hypothetical protein [Methylobacterium sp. ID0610]|uniref:hypothetical protein n=1 Tax=Methylobacterium carpenticola TaxID=3344827 RepID=UPI00368286E4